MNSEGPNTTASGNLKSQIEHICMFRSFEELKNFFFQFARFLSSIIYKKCVLLLFHFFAQGRIQKKKPLSTLIKSIKVYKLDKKKVFTQRNGERYQECYLFLHHKRGFARWCLWKSLPCENYICSLLILMRKFSSLVDA